MSYLFDGNQWDEHLLRQLISNMSRESNASGGLEDNLTGGGTLAVVAGLLDRCVATIVVIAGLIGNLIALFVFSKRYMQRRSSNVYLAAISVVGVCFLASVMLSWTARTSFDVYKLNGACQILTYVTHVSNFLSVWYVVCFTVERYIAVHYPLRRLSLCTAIKARRTVVALAVFAGVTYHYAAWTSDVVEPWPGGERICAPLLRYSAVLSAVHAVDTVITLLVPFVVITVLNARIAVTIFRHNRARQKIAVRIAVRRYARAAHGVNRDRDRLHLRRYVCDYVENRRPPCDQFRMTKLLLTVSIAFLALNSPRHAARAYTLFMTADPRYRPSLTFLVCAKLFNVVHYTHFAVNIVFYAIVGSKKFRSALRRRCRGVCRGSDNAVV